jgi:hypothetical protein
VQENFLRTALRESGVTGNSGIPASNLLASLFSSLLVLEAKEKINRH